MSRTTRLTFVMLSAGVLCACSGFRPHTSDGTRSRGGPLEPRRPADATPQGGDIVGRVIPAGAAAAGGRAVGGTRRICRKAARPSGWIAVAYVSPNEGDCAILARSDSGATIAVIAYYADLPVDTALDVCADEPAPKGWTIDEADGGSDSCPGVERNGFSTYRIRRVH